MTFTVGDYAPGIDPHTTGEIIRMRADRGFGFIRNAAEGKEYFFHAKDCTGDIDFAALKPGDKVRFIAALGEKGWNATQIEILK